MVWHGYDHPGRYGPDILNRKNCNACCTAATLHPLLPEAILRANFAYFLSKTRQKSSCQVIGSAKPSPNLPGVPFAARSAARELDPALDFGESSRSE
jgi:hypothetical protein